jgi:hypothetical protein
MMSVGFFCLIRFLFILGFGLLFYAQATLQVMTEVLCVTYAIAHEWSIPIA